MIVRGAKIFLVASVGVLVSLVGLNNLLDYNTNFEAVRRILAMDSIPQDSPLLWRSITASWMHHLVYWFIIATEFGGGILCLLGAKRLAQSARSDAAMFNAAKSTAIMGFVVALALYFVGFMIVGGEWFQMWRANAWNMQEPAFRFIGSVALMLVFLNQRDD
jgi:predicted small integral membrane protein